MKTILYATDGSDSAREAGRFAATLLNGWKQADLVGLYVTQEIAFPYRIHFSEGDEQREVRHTKQVQKQVYEETFRDFSEDRIAFVHEDGRTPQVICDVADAKGADLIVVGSHGYNFVDRVILGSVSHEVLHRSSVPVLIVPADRDGQVAEVSVKRILFAADGSPETFVTAGMVRTLLETWPQAEATVVYVQKAIQPYYRDHLSQAIVEEEKRWAEELERTLTTEKFTGLENRVHFASAEGNPATEICRLASEDGYDLVVVGSHDFPASETFLYGSVSTAVAHRSKVPVLVVKRPRVAAEALVGEFAGEGVPQQTERKFPSYPPLL